MIFGRDFWANFLSPEYGPESWKHLVLNYPLTN